MTTPDCDKNEAYEAGYENGYLAHECMGPDAPTGMPSDDEWGNALPTWVTEPDDVDAFLAGCKDGWAALDDLAEAGLAP